MTNAFDLRRITNLLRRDLIGTYRVALIAAAAIAGLMLIQAMLQPLMGDRTIIDFVVLGVLCFVGGPIVASRAFTELHDKRQNEAYLLLPASAAEKVVVRLFLVTVLFLAGSFVVVTATAWLIWLLEAVLLGRAEVLFRPLDAFVPGAVGTYLVQQSLFFVGAAWFRKQHFLRTGLALTVISIALSWICIVIVRLLWPDVGPALVSANFNPAPIIAELARSYSAMRGFMAALFYGVLPVFCWYVAWLRVRETEVSHGV